MLWLVIAVNLVASQQPSCQRLDAAAQGPRQNSPIAVVVRGNKQQQHEILESSYQHTHHQDLEIP
jgi:hypothetical protein